MEGRPPATFIFRVPGWVAWGRALAVARRGWHARAHRGKLLPRGQDPGSGRCLDGGCHRTRVWRGVIDWSPDADRRDYGHPGSPRYSTVFAAGASPQSSGCQAVTRIGRHHDRRRDLPRPRPIFPGRPPLRAPRNHHPSFNAANGIVTVSSELRVPRSGYRRARRQWY
jgi:hypothetical protein